MPGDAWGCLGMPGDAWEGRRQGLPGIPRNVRTHPPRGFAPSGGALFDQTFDFVGVPPMPAQRAGIGGISKKYKSFHIQLEIQRVSNRIITMLTMTSNIDAHPAHPSDASPSSSSSSASRLLSRSKAARCRKGQDAQGQAAHGAQGHGAQGHGAQGHGALGHGAQGHGALGHGAHGHGYACRTGAGGATAAFVGKALTGQVTGTEKRATLTGGGARAKGKDGGRRPQGLQQVGAAPGPVVSTGGGTEASGASAEASVALALSLASIRRSSARDSSMLQRTRSSSISGAA